MYSEEFVEDIIKEFGIDKFEIFQILKEN